MKKYFSVDSSHIDMVAEFEDQTKEPSGKKLAKAVTVVGKLILLGLAVIMLTALMSKSNLFSSINKPQDDDGTNDDGKAHDYTSNVYLPNTFEDLKTTIHRAGCPAIILGDKLYEASGVIWPTAVCQDLGTRIRMTVTRGMTKAVYTFDSTNNELRSLYGNELGLRATYNNYFPRASANKYSPFIFIVQPNNWPTERTYHAIPSFEKALGFAKNGFCPKLKLIGVDVVTHDRIVVDFDYSSCTWSTFQDKEYVQFTASTIESGNALRVHRWIFWVTMVSDRKTFDCASWDWQDSSGIGYNEHVSNGKSFSFGKGLVSSFRCDSQSVQMLF